MMYRNHIEIICIHIDRYFPSVNYPNYHYSVSATYEPLLLKHTHTHTHTPFSELKGKILVYKFNLKFLSYLGKVLLFEL